MKIKNELSKYFHNIYIFILQSKKINNQSQDNKIEIRNDISNKQNHYENQRIKMAKKDIKDNEVIKERWFNQNKK